MRSTSRAKAELRAVRTKQFSLKEIWQAATAEESTVILRFSSTSEAVSNLVRWEAGLQHIAAQFKFEAICIQTPDHDPMFLRPRLRLDKIQLDFLPLPPHGHEERIKYLVCDRRQIPSELVDLLAEVKNSDSVIAIVDWAEQRQIIMNAACNNIPIGASLDECINYTRYDYWRSEDVAGLQTKVSETRGEVVHEAFTLDPTLRARHPDEPNQWDWIRIVSRFQMLDCGQYGLYQVGRNLEYERRAIAPA